MCGNVEITFFILSKSFYMLTFLHVKKRWITPKKVVDKLVHNMWKGGKERKTNFYILYIYKK